MQPTVAPSWTSPRAERINLTVHPHRAQAAILTATARTVAAIAGTGGGKTVIGMIWLMLSMARRRGELWLVVEPTWPMVDRILLNSSAGRVGLVDLWRSIDPEVIYHAQRRALHCALGTIYLASATNPESMEGAHVAGAWLDEAGQMPKLAYETAQRRASFKSGQLLITTTPYNRGWLFTDVYQKWKAGDPDYFVSQFSSLANPAYPRDILEGNRRSMSPARFRMMHEGGFERPEGMIYSQWNDSMIVDPFPIPHDWAHAAGIDFGFNHPTAAVWAARDPDGVYYIYREHRKSGELLATHHQALIKPNGQKPDRWYADPSARQSIAELRRLGLPLVPANNDVPNGVDTVATLMATGRLKVFRTCKNWLDEVESYVWDTKDDIKTDKPRKVDDDLMDATRYLLHTQEKALGPRLFI